MIRRWTFNIATVVSLLLFVATAVLWLQSYVSSQPARITLYNGGDYIPAPYAAIEISTEFVGISWTNGHGKFGRIGGSLRLLLGALLILPIWGCARLISKRGQSGPLPGWQPWQINLASLVMLALLVWMIFGWRSTALILPAAVALLDSLPQDRPVKSRQTFGRIGTRVEHHAQFLFLLQSELGLGPRLTLGPQRGNPVPAITAHPLIHELPGAIDRLCDRLAFQFTLLAQAFAGDQHHPIAIPLLGVGLAIHQIT
jgi:hypothetical protein